MIKAAFRLAILALWPLSAAGQMPSAAPLDPAAALVIPEITPSDDWQIVCTDLGCQAEPRQSGSPDLSLTVIQDDTGPIMILRAPLGLLLGEGIAVTVDGRSLGRLAFLTCEVDGCVAPVRLDGSLYRALRGGSAMTLKLLRRDQSEINATYSLIGFISAMTALEATLSDGGNSP